ncbi:bifunctional 3-deoxy-7-phosphoheptulonate synthase/chorismate mutase [Salipaludibacillus agaradhaerens]|jgi:3-deoxy-7-phosphoheptulonate synthase/chorismate mutase|uniref:Bifunctional 3-deoxy-7-phosphoheptulonate synthase/chorismate mutase n=1 Tax=Salipaludibacillus agaradhaerens TaxID=76935 RepID=A0A9Q4FXW0_SALAG|nr:bifunctional 3-deoxy-7-phosphoheptulonate synthase/chorismate mutase [Salipaludibacillus agaradhaerens]UJW58663.1 bifunctional 3-deoxy-7-phosphoheptulonate synthase/chorismate mutase [Bacillus sp. A116_S68]MCR6095492.1 bifunctional 3-deoxy-7-phosphoheptulonate synthase/chorismate mutase [Salipaludibacillus agaradhaerens]MCR6107622.1 bifunctional 3-deoxy-7-phosphoheptulonate synthase/chorismate mutase [Salipaludibacillus agaradhaerens]MCR6114948.1 bifunctional 3-deoxy-7-phosphoheptulonate syn
MGNEQLEELRDQLDSINEQLVELINERAKVAQEIGRVKRAQGLNRFDPVRERKMLDIIENKNKGPFETSTLQHIFKQIFKASLELQEDDHSKALLVSRKKQPQDTIVTIRGEKVGNGEQRLIAGPCSVESFEQVDEVAKALKKEGIKFLRGGAYKPRTSPYDFQGLGEEGLKILKEIADKHDLAVISEIVTPHDIEKAVDYLDVIQIGARNMQNFELLKAAGSVDKPILLKRGLSATIQEFINAAEYIHSKGNGNIMLCERGIRTYETATRNTLDISAVPILKQETHLPVFVDVTHSTGRRDLLLPTAKAALAVGADGVMTEVHPDPAVALSDSAQQMDIPQFHEFMKNLEESGLYKKTQAASSK